MSISMEPVSVLRHPPVIWDPFTQVLTGVFDNAFHPSQINVCCSVQPESIMWVVPSQVVRHECLSVLEIQQNCSSEM